MQACHILLGRPWEFDKDSMHHGRLNQYSFLHHDKKIVLHPMSPEAITHDDTILLLWTVQSMRRHISIL
jgi:hypothetical protein